jgi:Flp pilus assembly protein TadD
MLALALAASVLLAGCQNKMSALGGDDLTTASTTSTDNTMSFKRTEALAKQWEKDKGNLNVGLAYAANLEKLGQKQQQMQVLKQLADANPGNGDVQARVGKIYLTSGDTGAAISVLERAVAANPNDWQSLSALGSAYDQMSRHGEAREQYQKALAIKPDAIAVRNNFAMSFALQGKLPEAEKMLRELMTTTGSNAPRVRQNLALVVGLQGRFDEARKIASEDLPPDQVDANLAYLQQMLAQPNTWKQLQENG